MEKPSQPLPPNDFNHITDFNAHCAYKRCLAAEEKLGGLTKDSRCRLICIRLLGYMLREAPTSAGRQELATEIIRCQGDESLHELGLIYQGHFIRCFRSIKGHTPKPSHHPSAPSFDQAVSFNFAQLQPTPSSHEKAKKSALERDGYCCMITRRVDSTSFMKGLVLHDGQHMLTTARAAHIFDRSTNEDLDNEEKRLYAASVHTILDRFGRVDTIAELNGANVHRLENILTLSPEFHDWFDQLRFWLERDPTPTAVTSAMLVTLGSRITFTTHDSTTHPLPSPRLLELHAACARIAHLSGAGEYADKVLRDMETIGVLANDGSSDVLTHALLLSTARPIPAY
ncbi:hypothetical protein BDN72DRAFT_777064 [Pluteus cervinus]|uniref:Uncharacterized protein n=1 Tax=Pluteus cervinus TaxID=181527 RepID=A0ACD3A9Q0_9AGAR|nr:hypothetical protein BDN72DRAFT_777064 [Pluteus cervinus]